MSEDSQVIEKSETPTTDTAPDEAAPPEKDSAAASSTKRKSTGKNRRSLFSDDEGDLFQAKSLEPGELDLLQGHSKSRSGGKRASKSKAKKKKSLFDDLANGEGDDDFFQIKKKGGKKKSIDLFGDDASSEPKSRKSSAKNVQEMLTEIMATGESTDEKVEDEHRPGYDTMARLDEIRKMFEFKDQRMWFAGPNELRSEIMRRFDKFEKLVDSLDFSETGNSDLSSPIPGIVLKESVQRLVADLHDKDQILKEKDLLIDYLQESVDSTFERDEILRQHERKREEIEAERKITESEESVCDELQAQVDALEGELREIQKGFEEREKEIRTAHEQEQYKVACLHYEEHEPLEERIKTAKTETMKCQIELSSLLADTNEKKGRVNLEAFDEFQKVKGNMPKILTSVVVQMRKGLEQLLDNAFNPLKEYPGDKIHVAMRNALQTVGKKVIAKAESSC